MRPLLQDWEKWLFYLMHRTHRASWKMMKQRDRLQMKEQDKTSEKEVKHK